MAYNEEDFLLLSGLQHFAFCRRQWALIHIEQQWADRLQLCAQGMCPEEILCCDVPEDALFYGGDTPSGNRCLYAGTSGAGKSHAAGNARTFCTAIYPEGEANEKSQRLFVKGTLPFKALPQKKGKGLFA